MKAVISMKGLAFQKEVDKDLFVGKKIGEKISGNAIADLGNYEFEITGGSDKDGFAMRKGMQGAVRKRVLVATGPGYCPKKMGIRRRKSICGEVISERIAQVNLKVLKEGDKKFDDFIPKKDAPAEGEGEKKE
ncbi:MAG: 30S ribosomal protein S6e [Candidatus Aenigmarchaeota archaeon]|nr:30S ribosomal protein S6e [Candidatus Aenigmarchaeota archaeon]